MKVEDTSRPAPLAGGLVPLSGGYSGETFLAEGGGERMVVRIYAGRGAQRGTHAAEIDATVLKLVRGLLPVPTVLQVRYPDEPAGQPGVLVTSFLPGQRLDEALPHLDSTIRAAVARNLGQILGRLAQMPMPRAGRFTDGDLRIEPWPGAAADLVSWAEYQRADSALAAWPDELHERLLDVADAAQQLLGELERVCLVHGDFNPKNLLIDPADGTVTGLLDWEFAHAGVPLTDLGNLLRFEQDPVFTDGVLDGYREVAGHLDGLAGLARDEARTRLLDLAWAADLMALVELAGRAGENPVADRAEARLHAIALSGPPHAGQAGVRLGGRGGR